MKTAHTPIWYEAKTGNHQGLIIDEKTGDNIAVTYEKTNAALIVRAVNSHDDLVTVIGQCILAHEQGECRLPADIVRGLYAALKLAKGE